MRRYKETQLNLRRKKIISQWLQGKGPESLNVSVGFKLIDEILLVGGSYNLARLEEGKVVVNYGPTDKKRKNPSVLLITIREILIESAVNLKIEVVRQDVPLNLSDEALTEVELQPWQYNPKTGYPLSFLTGQLGRRFLWSSFLYHIGGREEFHAGEKTIPKFRELLDRWVERTIMQVKELEALYPDSESFKLVRSMEGLADISKIGKHPSTSSAQLLSYKRLLAVFRLSLVGVSTKDDEGAKELDAEMATLYKFFGGKGETKLFFKRGLWCLFTLKVHPEQAPRFLSGYGLLSDIAHYILTKGV